MGEIVQLPVIDKQELALAAGNEYLVIPNTLLQKTGLTVETNPINPEDSVNLESEEYARSTRALRLLGAAALSGVNVEAATNQLQQEYESSIAEMIKSDEEFGNRLEITRPDAFSVVDGTVLAYDEETSIIKLVEDGARKSQDASMIDTRMETQHNRDMADLRNALLVNEMVSDNSKPNTRIVVSLEPIEAMDRDGAQYWENLNYTKGLAFIQVYHRQEDGNLATWTLSVDKSDKNTWRKVMANHNVIIPEEEVTDNWLDYALEIDVDDSDLEKVSRGLREEYYSNIPDSLHRDSINKHLEDNQEFVDQIFEQLYAPLAESLVDGNNTEVFQDFAREAQNIVTLKPSIRQRLFKISNSQKLELEDVKILEELVRYSVAEELRDGLKPKNKEIKTPSITPKITEINNLKFGTPNVYRQLTPIDSMINQMTISLRRGADAGRSYGSCGGTSRIARDPITDTLSTFGLPQDIFGGFATKPNDQEYGPDEDSRGPLDFECPDGHPNRREKNGPLLEKCQEPGCDAKITCKS